MSAAEPTLVSPSYPAWDIPGGLDTPVLLVDGERVQSNARRMAQSLRIRGVAFRPHAKTHKSHEVAKILLEAGAIGLTCATLGEAEVFAAHGVEDLFIAYPVWSEGPKAVRLAELAARCRLSVGLDSAPGAAALARVCGMGHVDVLLEVDSGERRTGAGGFDDAAKTAAACVSLGLNLVGVFTHGGHSYEAPANVAPAADDEVQALAWGAEAVEAAGASPRIRSAGSTPTALLSARDGVTEERPGTFIFGDRQQAMLGSVEPDWVALMVATTVVSRARSHVVIDAGAKTIARDRHQLLEGFGAVLGWPEARITRLYDHHAVVESHDGTLPSVGEVLLVVPNHVCPVVNLAEELLVVSDGRVVDRWAVDARVKNR